MAKPIGTLGTIPTIQVGGSVFTDLTNLIPLTGWAASTNYCTLRNAKTAATGGYAAVNTLTIYALESSTDSGITSVIQATLGYGDTDVNNNSAAAPTTPKYYGGDLSGKVPMAYGAAAGDHQQVSVLFQVPTTKYAFIRSGVTNGFFHAWGYDA